MPSQADRAAGRASENQAELPYDPAYKPGGRKRDAAEGAPKAAGSREYQDNHGQVCSCYRRIHGQSCETICGQPAPRASPHRVKVRKRQNRKTRKALKTLEFFKGDKDK